MQDFNEYVNSNTNKNTGNDFSDMVKNLAKSFDGKPTSELLKAIYEQAKKGKRNGTLTNSEIESFATSLAPLLDDKQRALLNKVIKELKNL